MIYENAFLQAHLGGYNNGSTEEESLTLQKDEETLKRLEA